ncbi:hypothetical protein [Gemmatimonas sp.]|uniref:hypothetical protein n=1 Tax=Gemmatimonas sp. TaxID=1962908 RepID=UPI003340B998
MTATERHPEYIGGPLCGDVVTHGGVPDVTIARPMIGRTKHGRGTYVYQRDRAGDFVLVQDVGVTS